jgi:hypothetical protein
MMDGVSNILEIWQEDFTTIVPQWITYVWMRTQILLLGVWHMKLVVLSIQSEPIVEY